MLAIYIIIVLLAYLPTSGANDQVELDLDNLIVSAEVKYNLPDGILGAMIQVESNGDHKAVNKDDGTKAHKSRGLAVASYGLMQIQYASALFVQRLREHKVFIPKKQRIKPRDLLDPETNIEYGAYYLKWLLQSHQNNISWALTCFNAGPHSSLCKNKKYNGEYVGRVLNALLSDQG